MSEQEDQEEQSAEEEQTDENQAGEPDQVEPPLMGQWSNGQRKLKFGPEHIHKYLEVLAATGLYIRGAEAVGCAATEIKSLRQDIPEFQAACDEAFERYRSIFIQEAQRRAVEGYEIPIIGGRNRDQIVAKETRYSDRLMELFLKRSQDGAFTDRQEVQVSGNVDFKQELDLKSLSKRARLALRELLDIINEDNANRALGNPVE